MPIVIDDLASPVEPRENEPTGIDALADPLTGAPFSPENHGLTTQQTSEAAIDALSNSAKNSSTWDNEYSIAVAEKSSEPDEEQTQPNWPYRIPLEAARAMINPMSLALSGLYPKHTIRPDEPGRIWPWQGTIPERVRAEGMAARQQAIDQAKDEGKSDFEAAGAGGKAWGQVIETYKAETAEAKLAEAEAAEHEFPPFEDFLDLYSKANTWLKIRDYEDVVALAFAYALEKAKWEISRDYGALPVDQRINKAGTDPRFDQYPVEFIEALSKEIDDDRLIAKQVRMAQTDQELNRIGKELGKRSASVSNILAGYIKAEVSLISLGARVFGPKEYANFPLEASVDIGAAEVSPGWVAGQVRGTTSFLTKLIASAATGGKIAPWAFTGLISAETANSGYTTAIRSGASETVARNFAIRQGVIVGAIYGVLNRVGVGGALKLLKGGDQFGLQVAAKRLGIATLSQIPIATAAQIGMAVNEDLTGINPSALDMDKLVPRIANAVVYQTLATAIFGAARLIPAAHHDMTMAAQAKLLVEKAPELGLNVKEVTSVLRQAGKVLSASNGSVTYREAVAAVLSDAVSQKYGVGPKAWPNQAKPYIDPFLHEDLGYKALTLSAKATSSDNPKVAQRLAAKAVEAARKYSPDGLKGWTDTQVSQSLANKTLAPEWLVIRGQARALAKAQGLSVDDALGASRTALDIVLGKNTLEGASRVLAAELKRGAGAAQRAGRGEITEAQAKERGERSKQYAATRDDLIGQGVDPGEASVQATRELAGPLMGERPTVPKEYIPRLTNEQWDQMQLGAIGRWPTANVAFTQHNASVAIQKLRTGVILTNSEMALMIDLLGPEVGASLVGQRTHGDRALQLVYDYGGILKTLVASGDISAAGRQTWPVMVSHPWMWLKGAGRGAKGFFFKQKAAEVMESIESDPWYDSAVAAGLPLTKYGPNVSQSQRAENFPSRVLGKVPLMERGERAFVIMQNSAMMGLYSMIMAQRKLAGTPTDGYAARVTARWAANMSGRAVTPTGTGAQSLINAANVVFFAPRNVLAKTENVGTAFGLASFDPFIRRQGLRTIAGAAATVTSMALIARHFGAEVPTGITDTLSADFMKIKIGDTRIDITGGHANIVRDLARVIMGLRKNEAGKIVEADRGDLIGQISRSKASPLYNLIMSAKTGRDWRGEDIEGVTGWTKAALESATYLWAQEAVVAFRDAYEKMGLIPALGKGAAVGIAEWVGLSTMTYPMSARNKEILFHDKMAIEHYGIEWEYLAPRTQKRLARQYPDAFRDIDREVQMGTGQRDDKTWRAKIEEQERKSGKAIEAKLPPEIVEELHKAAIFVSLKRVVDGWYMPDKYWTAYQEAVVEELNSRVGKLAAASNYPEIPQRVKDKRLRDKVTLSKQRASAQTIRQANADMP